MNLLTKDFFSAFAPKDKKMGGKSKADTVILKQGWLVFFVIQSYTEASVLRQAATTPPLLTADFSITYSNTSN